MPSAAAGYEKPRFRQDLVAEAIEDQGAKFIDVADPDGHHVFRFFEVEFSIACAMDGERDIAGIVKWAQDELGLKPSPAEVRTVISTLADLGYLDGTGTARAAAAAPPTRPQPGRDRDLAPGVVVGAPGKAASVGDVELGKAGVRAPAARADLPKSGDVALGAPGASAARPPRMPAEDVALGASGVPAAPVIPENVSLDLSDQVVVRPDDVKEAVRASKVMSAVEVPKDLMDAIESKPPPPTPVAKPVTPVSKPVEAKPVEAKPVEAIARPVEKIKPPVELKKPVEHKVPPVERESVVPNAPETRTSPLLIFALIVVVLGVGAFLVWKYVLKKTNTEPAPTGELGSASTTNPAPPEVKPEPTAPPPAPTKLALETPEAVEVKAPAAGQLEPFPANLKVVKRGDVIATLAGGRKIKGEVAILTKEIDRVAKQVADAQKKLDDATAAKKQAFIIKDLEGRLADRVQSKTTKETAKTAKEAELEKLAVKAPVDGQITYLAKPNTAATPETSIASIAAPPALVVTFKTDGAPAVASSVYVKVKDSDVTLTCTVAQATADGVKVACPVDNALDGKEVTFGGQAAEPAPGEKPTDKPGETPADKPGEKPAEKPADKPKPPTDKPGEKPADKPTDKPTDKPGEKPADKPIDPTEKPGDGSG